MIPIDFPGANTLLSDSTEGILIEPLCALRGKDEAGNVYTISRWKLTAEEADEFARTKTIWLSVMGEGPPRPALLTALCPFEMREPPEAPR